jgi:hypothetical protein
MDAAAGFGSATNSTYNGMEVDIARRQAREGRMHGLLDIALTCKRLAPVAQEVLCLSVSLPQPKQTLLADSRYQSCLTSFLPNQSTGQAWRLGRGIWRYGYGKGKRLTKPG